MKGFKRCYFILNFNRNQIVVVVNDGVRMFFFVVSCVIGMVFFVDENIFVVVNVNVVKIVFKVVFDKDVIDIKKLL